MSKFFNKYIIFLLSFYILWIIVLPCIFCKVVPSICENISLNTNYELRIDKPKLVLSMLPKANLIADKVCIKTKNSKDTIVLDNVYLSARILPLFSGKLHLNSVDIKSVTINSLIAEDLELDKDFFHNLNTKRIQCDEISIQSLVLKFIQQNIGVPVNYDAEKFYYKRTSKAVKLFVNSKLKIKETVSNANIDLYLPKNNRIKGSNVYVDFSNFDLAPLGDYLKHYLPNDITDIKGTININVDKKNLKAEFNNCSILMHDNTKSIVFPDNLVLISRFNITSKVINFEHVDIKSDNIKAVLSGTIKNYLDKSRTLLNLDVRIDESKIEDIVNLLPAIVSEDINIQKLKKYKFYGNVIGNFSLKGDIVEPSINGDVYISQAVLIKPIKNAKGATIRLNFTGKYLNFDVEVPAGGIEKLWVKGGVELYNVKYSDMRIWSTPNIDLVVAEEKIIPLHEILNFIIGPVPMMDIKGIGNVDIAVKGNRKNPHVWGNICFKNVTAYFLEMPNFIMTNANADLIFNDQNAEFKTSQALIDGKHIDISGTCNVFGKFNFNIESAGQQIAYLYKAIQSSTMIEDLKEVLPKIDYSSGALNFALKLFGTVSDIKNIKLNKNVFAKGRFEFLNDDILYNGLFLNKINGIINIDGVNTDGELSGSVGHSRFFTKLLVNNENADVSIQIPRLNVADILPISNDVKSELGNVFLNFTADYKGKVSEIEYEKIRFNAKILGSTFENPLKLFNGNVSLNKNKLKITNLKGRIKNSTSAFFADIDVDNLFNTPKIYGTLKLKDFDLVSLNIINNYSSIPAQFRAIRFENGKINLDCKISNNKINAYSDLGGIMLTYIPMDLPIKIVNGSVDAHNNSIKLIKWNILVDDMPILADGVINDIFKKQNFDIYLNLKPKQEFVDKYINKNQIYPIKIKGDIVSTTILRGVKDNFDIKSLIKMPKDSSIYYLGATVGDVENAIDLNLDAKMLNRDLRIKEFSYDKIISSYGKRSTHLNMLKVKGGIEFLNDDLLFKDLYIKTQNPTDAKIFNIIFRKPNIKQGQFTSDLKFNGRLSNPTVLGDFHIYETNIPFLETTMKNITFKFRDKVIDLSSKGEIFGNDITINAQIRNKLTVPYYVEKSVISTQHLDLNNLIDKIKLSQVDNYTAFDNLEGIDLSSIIVKDMFLSADNVVLRNLVAKDFESRLSLSEKKVLDIDNFRFNVANGALSGKFKYNLLNSDTVLSLKAKNINANDISNALFDLDNQIYGDLTGDTKLTCKGETFENCMKTLNGYSLFKVKDGRMPKLGSLEYLLKAGNLIKGGITGISINSVIDVITPLKTGDFSSIDGVIGMKSGVAEKIEIATQGKNLSLFISGKYNFDSADADMEVLGMLSKKLSTMFGPLGNFSINTLFNAIPGIDLTKNTKLLDGINKIPGIELSSKSYRKFIAEIKGNIKGDDYVTSFKWIN